jgi:SAM-dependent methyltransferase
VNESAGRGLARLLAQASSWRRDAVSGDDRLFHWLESPRFERLGRAGTQRFSGWVLWYGQRLVTGLDVTIDAMPAASIPVGGRREEIARSASSVPGATRCGFAAEVTLPDDAGLLSLTARFADEASEPLCEIDVASLRRRRFELDGMAERVDAIPLPDAALVYLTQGLRDPEFYRSAIVPAVLNVVAYLESSGSELRGDRRVLDFGCGSGRLLVGWHALGRGDALSGCDINGDLIDWARTNLPPAIEVRATQPQPPLPYADAAFDTVLAVSVFTHLSLASQRQWVAELRRIVRPGGELLVTLHGDSYVPHIFPGRPEVSEELRRRGHVVTPIGAEGSNQFASLHTRGFARRLFEGFTLAGFFPNGRLGGRRLPYPTTSILQDVYVFRRSR